MTNLLCWIPKPFKYTYMSYLLTLLVIRLINADGHFSPSLRIDLSRKVSYYFPNFAYGCTDQVKHLEVTVDRQRHLPQKCILELLTFVTVELMGLVTWWSPLRQTNGGRDGFLMQSTHNGESGWILLKGISVPDYFQKGDCSHRHPRRLALLCLKYVCIIYRSRYLVMRFEYYWLCIGECM